MSGNLVEKEGIYDLESLDNALLDILQSEPLRLTMETYRDQILTTLFSNMLSDSNNGGSGGDGSGEYAQQ